MLALISLGCLEFFLQLTNSCLDREINSIDEELQMYTYALTFIDLLTKKKEFEICSRIPAFHCKIDF